MITNEYTNLVEEAKVMLKGGKLFNRPVDLEDKDQIIASLYVLYMSAVQTKRRGYDILEDRLRGNVPAC
jgi:hypothetical protein